MCMCVQRKLEPKPLTCHSRRFWFKHLKQVGESSDKDVLNLHDRGPWSDQGRTVFFGGIVGGLQRERHGALRAENIPLR